MHDIFLAGQKQGEKGRESKDKDTGTAREHARARKAGGLYDLTAAPPIHMMRLLQNTDNQKYSLVDPTLCAFVDLVLPPRIVTNDVSRWRRYTPRYSLQCSN